MGLRDPLVVELRQAVDSLAEKVLCLVLAVPCLVGILVAEPEVGAQVDDPALFQEFRDDLLGRSVRHRAEGDIGFD